jgi:ABC-2 type transport system ATP-binding protein
VIRVDSLSKSFGPKRAVDGVSFEVGKGEVLGFLGPNGAGKSTTIRMITGFIPPTAGRISVRTRRAGGVRSGQAPHRLPARGGSSTDMSVLSFLKFSGHARPAGRVAAQRAAPGSRSVPPGGVLGQTIDTLSGPATAPASRRR